MIHGIGIDIVSVERIQKNISRYGSRFPEKILTASELEEYAKNSYPARFLAKRFAAKEALAKALGTGFRDGIHLAQITVTHNSAGRPQLSFDGNINKILSVNKIQNCYLSLSDEKEYACAVVVLEY